jgi:hypothetical protein
VLEHREVEAGARHVGERLAVAGREPVRAHEGDLLVHHPVHVERPLLADAADVDRGAAAQAFTCTSTSVGRGFGTGSCSSTIGLPISCSRAASMVVMWFPVMWLEAGVTGSPGQAGR